MRLKIAWIVIVMTAAAAGAAPALQNSAQHEVLFEKARFTMETKGDLNGAIEIFDEIIKKYAKVRDYAAKSLYYLGICYEKLGEQQAQQARTAFQRIIVDYPDQVAEVTMARQKLAAYAEATKQQVSEPTFRKINIAGGIAPGAEISSDGARLAMVSDRDVWVVNLRGEVSPEIAGAPMRLTQAQNAIWPVTWSFNGQWIAYSESDVPSHQMYVLSASGGESRKLASSVPVMGYRSVLLSLSSDGNRLAYSIKLQEDWLLQIVSVITGEVVKRVGNSNATEPRFSPDDRHIAYVRVKKGGIGLEEEVRVAQLSDGSDFLAAEIPGGARSPCWSPDGSMLAFLAQPSSEGIARETELWITRILWTEKASGEFTRIRLPGLAQRIAGWTSKNKIGLLCISPMHNALYTVPLSGGKATQVTPDDAGVFLPQWSPDGEKIYFRWGKGDIACVPAAGGPIRVVSPEGDNIIETLPGGGNHVSPDGTHIVFSAYQKGVPGQNTRLWIMPIAGGTPAPLPMRPDLIARQPRWSPDGRWIAFESERGVTEERKLDENIFIVSSEGGEPRQLTSHTDCFCELMAWSPAGDSIAYACSDKTIRIIPFSGGEPRSVVKDEELEDHQGSLAWTPDGSRLLYTAQGRLWSVSTAGGEPTALKTDMDGNIRQFALSPDGKTIAFNAPSGGDPELWFMENFLPLVK